MKIALCSQITKYGYGEYWKITVLLCLAL